MENEYLHEIAITAIIVKDGRFLKSLKSKIYLEKMIQKNKHP